MATFRVLLVEDDPLILMTAADTLRDSGFEVIEVETADGALDLLEQDPASIAALFSDIETPGQLNGLDLACAVAERWPAIPVVLTSGHVFPPVDTLPPTVRFVGKPYDLDAVAKLIRNLSDD